MAEAADALGFTVDAVRSRVKRGTIDHVRVGSSRVYVLLGADEAHPGHVTRTPPRSATRRLGNPKTAPPSLSPRSGSSCRPSVRPTPKPVGC